MPTDCDPKTQIYEKYASVNGVLQVAVEPMFIVMNRNL